MSKSSSWSITLSIGVSFFAFAADAKVVPVHEYQVEQLDTKTITATCGTYGYIDKDGYNKTENADCSTYKLFDGTTCYKCSCPSNYKYTDQDCNSTGYKAPTDPSTICNDGSGNKYTMCACANDYVDLTTQNGYNTKYFEYNGTPATSKGPKCYKADGFSCKDPYKALGNNSKTVNLSPGPYNGNKTVTYITTKPFDSSSLECVYGISYDTSYVFTAAQSTGTTCHNLHTYTPPLYTQTTLYYYNGCSTNNMCYNTAPTSPCISYKSHTFKGEICYETEGCKPDETLIENNTKVCSNKSADNVGFSGTSSAVGGANKVSCTILSCSAGKQYYPQQPSDKFKYTSATRYGLTCYKITGCNADLNCQSDNPGDGVVCF